MKKLLLILFLFPLLLSGQNTNFNYTKPVLVLSDTSAFILSWERALHEYQLKGNFVSWSDSATLATRWWAGQTFAPIATVSSQWVTNGTTINYPTGNVGIGVTNPAQKLDVNGDALIHALTIGTGASNMATNTAIGYQTLNSNIGGYENTAIGYNSLFNNIGGYDNVATGFYSLYDNISGIHNTANGVYSLRKNKSGNRNTATGYYALFNDTTGHSNTANGVESLWNNRSGNYNTSIGYQSLYNSIGSRNIGIGVYAGKYETGSNNVFIDNLDRGTESRGRTESLIYGVTSTTLADQRLSLGGGGRVGINTTNPSTALDVNGVITATGGTSTDWNAKQSALTNPVTGTGVSGYLPHFTGTSTIDSSSLYYDAANKRLGIGTTAPGDKLNVIGNITAKGTSIALQGSTGNTVALFQSDANHGLISLSNATPVNTVKIRSNGISFLNGGYIGIGTTNPGVLLDVNGNIKSGGTIYSSDFSSWGSVDTRLRSDMGISFYINGTRMYINSSGNVGIGTTAPASALDVNGTISLSGTQAIKYPTGMTGSMVVGNGGVNMQNTTGEEGYYNTLLGVESGGDLTKGLRNTFVGYRASRRNTTGNYNTSLGTYSGYNGLTAVRNVNLGHESGYSNYYGGYNVLIGDAAGYSLSISNTVAVGGNALTNITTGANNVGIGYNSGRYAGSGTTANQTSASSLYLGYDTRASANGNTNEIVIGANAIGSGSNSVTLGHTDITKTVLRGNVGIGTTNPLAKLHVAGTIQTGVVAKVTADTVNALRLYGNSTVFEDLRIDGLTSRGGPREPVMTDNFAGVSGMYQRFWQGSAQDDEMFFNVQMPHQWKEGGKFELHIHNCPWTTPGAADSVVWEITYEWENMNGTYGTFVTDTVVQRLNGTAQWQHKLVEVINLNTPASGKTISSILACRLRRLANGSANDTYTGGMTVLYIDGHYEIDALGSQDELTK